MPDFRNRRKFIFLGWSFQEEIFCIYSFFYDVLLYQFFGYLCAYSKQTKIGNFPGVVSPRGTFLFLYLPFFSTTCRCTSFSLPNFRNKNTFSGFASPRGTFLFFIYHFFLRLVFWEKQGGTDGRILAITYIDHLFFNLRNKCVAFFHTFSFVSLYNLIYLLIPLEISISSAWILPMFLIAMKIYLEISRGEWS
jgi:hypothetical protein